MRKVFFNAMSYDNGGWFICEAHDWPYKTKTDKPWSIVKPNPTDSRGTLTVNDDPEVQAHLKEREEVNKQLHDEMVKVATELNLKLLDWNGNEYADGAEIKELVLDDADGKKLTDRLISLGWELEFIAIGP
jgi:hypothetical protein